MNAEAKTWVDQVALVVEAHHAALRFEQYLAPWQRAALRVLSIDSGHLAERLAHLRAEGIRKGWLEK